MRQTTGREAAASELKNLYLSEIRERFPLDTASFSERVPELRTREEHGLHGLPLCAPLTNY